MRQLAPEMVLVARALRQHLTPAEHLLWEELRKRRLAGLRFRSQHPIGSYVLDFYCPAFKLAIEIDGLIHETRSKQDHYRTEVLNLMGITVLRFSNAEIFNELPRVLERISAFCLPSGLP